MEKSDQKDLLNDIIAYEQGELELEEMYDLFQRLVDNGMVWQLQGHYGRMARILAEEGWIKLKE